MLSYSDSEIAAAIHEYQLSEDRYKDDERETYFELMEYLTEDNYESD